MTNSLRDSQLGKDTDIYKGDIPGRLPTHIIKNLSDINAVRTIAALVTEWGAILVAIAWYQQYWSLLLFPVVVMWIGARQHALAVLMHEGSHYHLFRNRALNDVVSEVFLAWPLFITTQAYRTSHFAHHRHVNTDRDPDFLRKQGAEWIFPKTWPALGLLLLKDVFGLNTYQQLLEVSDLSDPKDGRSKKVDSYSIVRIVYYVSILAVVTYFQIWPIFLLLWIVPLLTWLKMILRIRSIAEHYSVENDHVYSRTRTTLPSIVEKLLIAPRNINYHLEHHLYPSVPFFRLPKLHALLMKDVEFRSKAHLTSTYWGVLRECVGSR